MMNYEEEEAQLRFFIGFGSDGFIVGNGSTKRLMETKFVGESPMERLRLDKSVSTSLEIGKIGDGVGVGLPAGFYGERWLLV